MKKVFGWIFILLGIGNIIRGIAMAGNNSSFAGGLLIWAIVFILLGIWMVSGKSKSNQNEK